MTSQYARNLEKLIKAKGLTRRSVALTVGIEPSTLWRQFASGNIPMKTREAIARLVFYPVFGVGVIATYSVIVTLIDDVRQKS